MSSAKEWMNRKEAAAHLAGLGYPIAPRTLAKLANLRRGPPYRRILHRLVAYNRDALEAWVRKVTVEVAEEIVGKAMPTVRSRHRRRIMKRAA